MSSDAPNALIKRLEEPLGPPNVVIAGGETEGKLQQSLSPRKKGPDPLFKEARLQNNRGDGDFLSVAFELSQGFGQEKARKTSPNGGNQAL